VGKFPPDVVRKKHAAIPAAATNLNLLLLMEGGTRQRYGERTGKSGRSGRGAASPSPAEQLLVSREASEVPFTSRLRAGGRREDEEKKRAPGGKICTFTGGKMQIIGSR
jgi:hypothetical protein